MAYINKINVNGQEVNCCQLEGIIDSNEKDRFQEGEGTVTTQTGLTTTYCRWSLSGTHLMLVFAGEFEADTTFTTGVDIVKYTLPTWILNKIVGSLLYNAIEVKSIPLYSASSYTESLTAKIIIQKVVDGVTLYCHNVSSSAPNVKTIFRVQFDLLIDND